MTLTRKDAVATTLVGLAVLAFLATHQACNVPLIGDSHRLVLQVGDPEQEIARIEQAVAGVAA